MIGLCAQIDNIRVMKDGQCKITFLIPQQFKNKIAELTNIANPETNFALGIEALKVNSTNDINDFIEQMSKIDDLT